MSPSQKIGIIIGSTRAKRIGPSVAELIKKLLQSSPSIASSSISLSLVDIAAFSLPVFDEPAMPAMVPAAAQFIYPHSIAWSEEIAKYDGYILVTPEYNYGAPGGVKNAIDYLYTSWIGKPIMVVSYGIHGGIRASESLARTLEGMKLKVVGKRVMLEFPGKDVANRNMSPSLIAAIGGVLHEAAVQAWEGQKGELLEAFEELEGLVNGERK